MRSWAMEFVVLAGIGHARGWEHNGGVSRTELQTTSATFSDASVYFTLTPYTNMSRKASVASECNTKSLALFWG